ncbi:ATP-binding cassette domain-containing protein [Mycoplasmopsis felis]|uniref:ATP-binding cassette domain-containing protein n=1 Tax=Mycoplasmopsis felis TaxID=33923 RepID=UPI0021B02281|nr:ABC transporter ATP-binding protein [Mycoplasmopsis felis]MCU9934462.1 ABC transporter ATP-binding protein [Mycoplasmopsis felis]UWV84670.1 ABC transporter ATP-binding protein [Mycoplasmopsis felis]WQQ08261.1 ABC transporter ATP-binding protein [Mycoplasmopsis felis]
MIKLNDLTLKYDNSIVLKNINITFQKNEIVGLIGKSGSGKTTLLKALFDFDIVKSGKVTYNSTLINNKVSKKEILEYKNKISYIQDGINLIENLDFFKNVQLFYKKYKNWFYKTSKIFTKKQKEEIFDLCSYFELIDLIFTPINKLSTGQKQRFSLIINLINNTEILLGDEITSNLDYINSQKVYEYLQELKKEKIIILSIHNLNDAIKYTDKIIAIKNQEIKSIYLKENYNIKELMDYFD